jgi:hypothetical protein
MSRSSVAIVLSSLITLLGGTAAASVVVTLECSSCTVTPLSAVLIVGQTLEFACDANCGPSCGFVSFGGITSVAPFDVTVPAGSSSAPLGPATVPGEISSYQASQQDGTQDCSFGTGGQLVTTAPDVPGLTQWGAIGLASLLVAATAWTLHRRSIAT